MASQTNKNLIIVILLVACGILIGNLVWTQLSIFKKPESNVIPKEEAAKLALTYINENLLPQGIAATSKGEVTEEEGLYKFKVEVGGNEFFSYITKDGEVLFPQGFNLKEKNTSSKEPSGASGEQKASCENLKKVQKPVLEVFVVSYCPYGTQMQRILTEVVKNIPELAANIKIEYMGQVQDGKIISMHGEKEAEENLTQICLREEENNKYFSYLSCFLQKGDQKECLTKVGIDQKELENCKNDESRGLTYAQKDFDLENKYKVTGSPTLILNGEKVSEFDFGGRTAESVKTLLCCGFEKENSFCKKTLTREEAATGFSGTYNSGQPNSGSCK